MTTTRLISSNELSSAELEEIEAFLVLSYEGDFAPEDFEHCLGGVHSLVHLDGQLVGHGALVRRQLTNGPSTFDVGYVEAVATHPEHRRSGVATSVMNDLEEVIARSYDFGALSTGDEAIRLYRGRGWIPWTGKTGVIRNGVALATPEDDGGIFLFGNVRILDPSVMLCCSDRAGDVW